MSEITPVFEKKHRAGFYFLWFPKRIFIDGLEIYILNLLPDFSLKI